MFIALDKKNILKKLKLLYVKNFFSKQEFQTNDKLVVSKNEIIVFRKRNKNDSFLNQFKTI